MSEDDYELDVDAHVSRLSAQEGFVTRGNDAASFTASATLTEWYSREIGAPAITLDHSVADPWVGFAASGSGVPRAAARRPWQVDAVGPWARAGHPALQQPAQRSTGDDEHVDAVSREREPLVVPIATPGATVGLDPSDHLHLVAVAEVCVLRHDTHGFGAVA